MSPVPNATGVAIRLRVYKDERPVGTLTHHVRGRLTFQYDDDVLGDDSALVSTRLPVRGPAYGDDETLPYFENLLPEGDMRQLVAAATKHAGSDIAGLLGVIGGECAGAVSLWQEGTAPDSNPRYRDCTASDLEAAMQSAGEHAGFVQTLRAGRLSMSGAQEKLVLDRRPPTGRGPTGELPVYRLPLNGAPSTVLVKWPRLRQYPDLVPNEIASMTLMEAAGVPTAPRGTVAMNPAVYETARFDRVVEPDGRITRLHAEDGCQLLGQTSQAKYGSGGSVNYKRLVEVLTRFSRQPQEDIVLLFRWAIANVCIGNRDAHAKNISAFVAPDGVITLAPAYDVVCTLLYPGIGKELPLPLGGERHAAALTSATLNKVAREFGIAPSLARDLIDDVARRVQAAVPAALERVSSHSQEGLVEGKLPSIVADECVRVRKMLASR